MKKVLTLMLALAMAALITGCHFSGSVGENAPAAGITR